MKDAQKINEKWSKEIVRVFNNQDAVIVFTLGLTKDLQIRCCATADVAPEVLKEKLRMALQSLGG
jgi:hypothetical protein